jgi:hypothetical protein
MRVVINASELKEIVILAILENIYIPSKLSDLSTIKRLEFEDYINNTETNDIDIDFEDSDLIINVPERN